MRTAVVCALLIVGLACQAQVGLRINELQASNSRTVADDGQSTPDWIELYNPATRPIDLQGMRLVLAGREHRFLNSLVIAPNAHLVLWCDGKPKRGSQHIGFTLPKSGGSVLLVHADGATILDAFTWKDMPHGISMARMPDGHSAWGYAHDPTPGTANPGGVQHASRLSLPDLQLDTLADGSIRIQADTIHNGGLWYTLNGAPVSDGKAQAYSTALTLEPGTVFRYRSLSDSALPSMQGVITVPRMLHAERITSLALDPEALHGDSTGIDTPGLLANNTRTGRAWERAALLDFDGVPPMPIGLRISGSGSRGLAKRSFKIYARTCYDSPADGLPFPNGSQFTEGILRADASPHAFLRNRLLETLVQQHGLAVDMQVSTPTALYINGRYWGLYRWMPPKDAQWAKAISGAEAVDVLAGPGHVAVRGNDRHFLRSREALMRGAPVDSLAELMDLRSLVDLACVDLWTGRADHDLNVRCYRPRQPGGLWRWMLFDMDLWSSPEENSVERMCSATGPEAPYVPQLLGHPELQERVLARMTALQATAFASQLLSAMVDSLYGSHEQELLADHRRWDLELGNPHPSASRQALQHFVAARPQYLMAHLAQRTGRQLRTISIDVPPHEQGQVFLDGLALPPGKQRIRCFSGVAMQLEALPAGGAEFAGWKGGLADSPSTTMVLLSDNDRIKPIFRVVVP